MAGTIDSEVVNGSKEERLAEALVSAVLRSINEDDGDALRELLNKHGSAIYSPLHAITMVTFADAKRRNAARDKAIEDVKARVDALEARPELRYEGPWKETALYGQNALVTFQGSLWIAKEASISKRPGMDDRHWQLCAKRGRDGKDGKNWDEQ